MKNDTYKEIEKEIGEITKIPSDLKNEIRKEIFTNIIVSIALIIYFVFMMLGSNDSLKSSRAIDLNIFCTIFLAIAIVLFEIAYRKDSGKYAAYGVESLAVSTFTLFLPYIIYELDDAHRKQFLIFSVYIASYYILKSLYISSRKKTKYINSLSDVKEILKDEPKTIDIQEELEKTEINDEKTEEVKVEEKKRRGRPRKENKKEIKVETKSRGRGRPKKVEINKEDNKTKDAPKRGRGRPRKVAEIK